MTLVDQIEQEWDILSQAPFVFIAMLLAALGIAFVAFRYLHKAEIINKDSQIKLANDRIAAYQSKLDVDSPEEAKQQMQRLEKRVSDLAEKLNDIGPKRLSDEQKKQIISAISISAGSRVAIIKDGASPDAATLSSDLADAFHRGGWEVSRPVVIGLGSPPRSGVAIAVPEPRRRSVAQQAVVNAFEAAEIDYEIEPLSERPTHKVDKPIAEITLTTPATL